MANSWSSKIGDAVALAYQIERHDHGRYIYLNYIGSAATPAEIERIVRIEDNVVRFLTVRLTETADYDESFPVALERQKKRINRSRRSDESADARRRRTAGHDNINSPSPIRYENADGSGEDMSAEFEEAEAAEEAAEGVNAEEGVQPRPKALKLLKLLRKKLAAEEPAEGSDD